MAKPSIQITLIDQKGTRPCHRGHRVGDRFDFDTQRGLLCPMAMHAAFPYVDILRYGGKPPESADYGGVAFCCPDADTVNVFRVTTNAVNEKLQEDSK